MVCLKNKRHKLVGEEEIGSNISFVISSSFKTQCQDFFKTHKVSKTGINILKAINMKMSSKIRWQKERIIITQVGVLNT